MNTVVTIPMTTWQYDKDKHCCNVLRIRKSDKLDVRSEQIISERLLNCKKLTGAQNGYSIHIDHTVDNNMFNNVFH